MATVFHGEVEDVIPEQALYKFPRQTADLQKQTAQIRSVNGGPFGPTNPTIEINLPTNGYLSATDSTLNFDLTLSPGTAPSGVVAYIQGTAEVVVSGSTITLGTGFVQQTTASAYVGYAIYFTNLASTAANYILSRNAV